MAKKVLTPEEVQAKLEKKAAKRKLFFGTFTKALAFFLAIAMVYTLAIIAFTPETSLPSGNTVQSNNTSNGFDDYDDGSASTGGDTVSNTNNNTNDGASSGGANTSDVAAEAIAAINAETAKAAKGNYNWKRVSDFTPDGAIDVGNATETLNKIIKGVDENADLNSVVGGFLGIGTKEAQVTGGKVTPDTGMKDQHLLVATKLVAGDIKSATKEGDTYVLKLASQKNPQKDGSNSLSHATNDFFTEGEVQKSISNAVGSAVKVESSTVDYYDIQIKATIKDGKLSTYELSYGFSATLNLKAAIIPITGKGKATNKAVYSNIKY